MRLVIHFYCGIFSAFSNRTSIKTRPYVGLIDLCWNAISCQDGHLNLINLRSRTNHDKVRLKIPHGSEFRLNLFGNYVSQMIHSVISHSVRVSNVSDSLSCWLGCDIICLELGEQNVLSKWPFLVLQITRVLVFARALCLVSTFCVTVSRFCILSIVWHIWSISKKLFHSAQLPVRKVRCVKQKQQFDALVCLCRLSPGWLSDQNILTLIVHIPWSRKRTMWPGQLQVSQALVGLNKLACRYDHSAMGLLDNHIRLAELIG